MDRDAVVQEFLDAYRAAFEAFDVTAVAGFFAFPCQVTSEAAEVTITAVPTLDAWTPQIERIIDAYRALGVATAVMGPLQVLGVTPRLAQAAVRWRLRDADGGTIYEFDASYSLADLGDGFRITAIAHNESPRLRAALGSRQGA